MIASLMMYARPETDAALGRYWQLLRSALADKGIAAPAHLSQTADPWAVWSDPELVLSQTCGLPFRRGLHQQVALIGTPDFGLDECAPGYYRSALVVRADDPRGTLAAFRQARFAFNQVLSQSGYAAARSHCAAQGFWFAQMLETGAHRASAKAVADGRADCAAIDAVTWRMIQTYDRFAENLRVLEWTIPTPGLPYIAGPRVDANAVRAAVVAAINALSDTDRGMLGIRCLIDIPEQAYLSVPDPD